MAENDGRGMSRWVETLGLVAVVLSLILVARELQQNTEATIGETSRGFLGMLVEIDAWVVDADFAALVARVEAGETELTATEAMQYSVWIYNKFNICENVYDRRAAGLVSEEYWLAWEGGCAALLEPPFAREVWHQRRQWYGPAFRAHFDEKADSLAESSAG